MRIENFVFGISLIYLSLAENEIDPKGYIMFCPCMGRFGNQAEQFLGALAFAKTLDRTLILPHWIEYPKWSTTSNQIPFDRYFQVEPLKKYLRVILMKDFMKNLANQVWPKGQRSIFCYMPHKDEDTTDESCHAKDGNPFGPFWSHFNIDFDKDIFYQPLYFDVRTPDAWNAKYPSSQYPVLTFSGVPGAFPALPEHIPLMKYIVFSDYIREQAEKFLNKNQISLNTLLAVHIRNGLDFERACTYANQDSNFFASGQCLGYNLEKGIKLTKDICYPSTEQILDQTKAFVEKYKPSTLFVAADGEPMIDKFKKLLGIKVIQYVRPTGQNDGEAAQIDLYIISHAKHAIVNCPSTFSAFAKRQRDAQDRSTDFWGIENGNDPKIEL